MLQLFVKVVSVLIVFIFLLAIHDWNVDNRDRYAIVEDTLVILRILIGIQFAVGMKIISDAITKQFKGSVEWTFMILSALVILTLPFLAIAAAFARHAFME